MTVTLRAIADLVGGKVIGDDRILIAGISALDDASAGHISFYFDNRFHPYLRDTKASAIIVSCVNDIYKGAQVVVSDPRLAYAKVAGIFAPEVPVFSGKSDASTIDDTASVGENTSIYPGVYIGRKALIGNNVIIFPGVFIGDGVRIGNETIIYPNVTILHDCLIGSSVIIHPGCVIGSDGFGFARDGREHIKIPHLGIVQIDDNVELGANTTIDRAALGRTWVKKGVKADNLIQIAHNVVVGEDTILVALTGISGSVKIGRDVVIGGQVGIGDHLEIGDRAMIGSGSGVYQSVSPGEVVSGNPTMPHRLWLKTRSLINRLPLFKDRLRDLEKKVEQLEKKIKKLRLS